MQGHLREAQERFRAILSREGASARTEARAAALYRASICFTSLADGATAQTLAEESFAIYQELNDKQGMGRVLCKLSRHPEELERSILLLRESGERPILAYAIERLGWETLSRGDTATARSLLEEAVAPSQAWGSRESAAHALVGLGRLGFCQGDHEEARTHYRAALEIYGTLGQRYVYIPSVMECLAATAAAQAQMERAARLWGAAEALREAIGAPLPPSEHDEYDRSIAAVRSALSAEAFAMAWAEGSGMSLERAVEYALAE